MRRKSHQEMGELVAMVVIQTVGQESAKSAGTYVGLVHRERRAVRSGTPIGGTGTGPHGTGARYASKLMAFLHPIPPAVLETTRWW